MSIATALQSDEKKIRIVPTSFDTQPTTAQYIYMRPNIENGGTLPASSPYCYCPDIWLAGTSPVSNYQTALATSDSYNTNPPADLYLNQTNYMYVRGFNGSGADNSVSVTLYYSPSSMIQYPGNWQNNIVPTDQGAQSANINNLASGTVGVADSTFIWSNVQAPPNGTGHYCLIAQFNDARNSNPFPDIYTPLDLSKLIQNNLMWGWHNVNMMTAPSDLKWSYDTGLTIADNLGDGVYSITVAPVGFIGWQVSFQCSEPDSNGNPITLERTDIKQDNVNLGINNVTLKAGYNAIVTVYMYNPDNKQPVDGATVPISASYLTGTTAEYHEALAAGIINWPLTRTLQIAAGMPIKAYVSVGSVTGQIQ